MRNDLFNVRKRRLMELKEAKPAVKSTGIWGSVLGVLPVVYLVEKALGLPAGVLDPLIQSGYGAYLALAAFLGLALQVYGRVRASGPISGLFRAKD
ncbi:MAG: hypothetical protein K2X87_30900 [Gemmataceae bacterium]|nr:hypothetical protein [Gemmataceae bacterium]